MNILLAHGKLRHHWQSHMHANGGGVTRFQNVDDCVVVVVVRAICYTTINISISIVITIAWSHSTVGCQRHHHRNGVRWRYVSSNATPFVVVLTSHNYHRQAGLAPSHHPDHCPGPYTTMICGVVGRFRYTTPVLLNLSRIHGGNWWLDWWAVEICLLLKCDCASF